MREAKRATKDFAAPRLSLVHTMTEEFENGGFTLKTRQMFSVHTTLEEFENATEFPVILDLCLKKERAGESYDYREVIVFKLLAPFSKYFSSRRKRNVGVFKFRWFEERFRKDPFS